MEVADGDDKGAHGDAKGVHKMPNKSKRKSKKKEEKKGTNKSVLLSSHVKRVAVSYMPKVLKKAH